MKIKWRTRMERERKDGDGGDGDGGRRWGEVVLCLSALVCLLVRAGAPFVFGSNLLAWVLQAR
jgi:hypothetical protein